MNAKWAVRIAGTGLGVPSTVVTNHDLEQRLDTSDEWIVQRTGIRERRIARSDESTLAFALDASRNALENAGIEPQQLDLIVVCTITPEHTLPSTSCELQAALGCGKIPAFDLVAACSGFVYGLVTAAQYIASGLARHVLLVGAETMTRMIDMEERSTAVLFGDGAGAAVLSATDDPQQGILHAVLGADGEGGKLLWVPAGGSAEPPSERTLAERLHYVRMRGREVYRFAVTQMNNLIARTLDEAGVRPDDVALLIPHQSNLRIIESACQKNGFPRDRVLINIDRYANTSAASIPIALDEARREGRLKEGDLVLMVAFGAGLTWGSALVRL